MKDGVFKFLVAVIVISLIMLITGIAMNNDFKDKEELEARHEDFCVVARQHKGGRKQTWQGFDKYYQKRCGEKR